jgi:hypothetical protein
MNWWLVAYHLKHGMMMVRPAGAAAALARRARRHGCFAERGHGRQGPVPAGAGDGGARSWHWRQA